MVEGRMVTNAERTKSHLLVRTIGQLLAVTLIAALAGCGNDEIVYEGSTIFHGDSISLSFAGKNGRLQTDSFAVLGVTCAIEGAAISKIAWQERTVADSKHGPVATVTFALPSRLNVTEPVTIRIELEYCNKIYSIAARLRLYSTGGENEWRLDTITIDPAIGQA